MKIVIKEEYEYELLYGKPLEPGQSSFYGSGNPPVNYRLDPDMETIPEALDKDVIDLPVYTL